MLNNLRGKIALHFLRATNFINTLAQIIAIPVKVCQKSKYLDWIQLENYCPHHQLILSLFALRVFYVGPYMKIYINEFSHLQVGKGKCHMFIHQLFQFIEIMYSLGAKNFHS